MTHEELVIERKWLIEMASKQITQGLINSANRLNHKLGVKITSPSKNATVPTGQLTISGISSDTAITNCMVSADWNDLKPMQNVTAKGPGGANDYSNWTYAYNETYHNITVGINELTSKITCYDATMSKTLDPTLYAEY